MKEGKNTKKLLIVLVLVAAAGLPIIYNNLKGGSSSGVFIDETQVSQGLAEVTGVLNRLQGVSLDTTVLEEREFSYLSDFSINLPSLPVGRPNPFASF